MVSFRSMGDPVSQRKRHFERICELKNLCPKLCAAMGLSSSTKKWWHFPKAWLTLYVFYKNLILRYLVNNKNKNANTTKPIVKANFVKVALAK